MESYPFPQESPPAAKSGLCLSVSQLKFCATAVKKYLLLGGLYEMRKYPAYHINTLSKVFDIELKFTESANPQSVIISELEQTKSQLTDVGEFS